VASAKADQIRTGSFPMLETVIDFICGFENVAFESDFDLDETISRLSAAIRPPLGGFRPLVSLKGTVVVGKVSEQRVSLWCERMFVRNGFRLAFVGCFQIVDKRVILIGKLGMNLQACLFYIPAFGMSLFFTLGTLLELTKSPHDPALWVMPIAGPVFALFWVGSMRLARWLSGGDERWLLAAIQSALRKGAPKGGAAVDYR
jgi:hypothetical protein